MPIWPSGLYVLRISEYLPSPLYQHYQNRATYQDPPGCVAPPTVTLIVASDVRRVERKILSCTMLLGENSSSSWLAILPVVPVDAQAAPGDNRYLGPRVSMVDLMLPRGQCAVQYTYQAVRPSCVIVAVPVLNRVITYGRKRRHPSCGIDYL